MVGNRRPRIRMELGVGELEHWARTRAEERDGGAATGCKVVCVRVRAGVSFLDA